MKIIIHRGTREIGASCVEITEGDHRIILDAGLPLDGSRAELPGSAASADGLFISHCHPDHHGLLENLHPRVPVYLSQTAEALLQASRLFAGASVLKRGFRPLVDFEPVRIGDMQLTPLPLDHSAPAAQAFLIEGKEKTILYSGDFRCHGREPGLSRQSLNLTAKKIDALIMEGTTIGRSDFAYPDEKSVEEAMLEAIRAESGAVFLLGSSQNLDRMISVFEAAKAGERKLVIDIYTAWILESISRYSPDIPRLGLDDVRVLSRGWPAGRHYEVIKNNPDVFKRFQGKLYERGNAIRLDQLRGESQAYVIKANQILRLLDDLKPKTATVIYSMWSGYMKAEHNLRQARELHEVSQRDGVKLVQIHTSGHATQQDLVELVQVMKPERIIPIHTLEKDKFPELFIKAVILDDGESLVL